MNSNESFESRLLFKLTEPLNKKILFNHYCEISPLTSLGYLLSLKQFTLSCNFL